MAAEEKKALPAVEAAEEKPKYPGWPMVITLPSGGTTTLEREDALMCACFPHKHVNMFGEDGQKYRVPNGALCSAKLFPKWNHGKNPQWLMSFRGDPKDLPAGTVYVVPGYSKKG